MRVDREKAKDYGFSANDVAQFIAIALRGMQLKDFHGGDSAAAGVAALPRHRRAEPRRSGDFKLRRPDGTQIPLLSMVQMRPTTRRR